MAKAMKMQQVFDADLDRMDRAFHALGAVVTAEDGFTYIDDRKAPAHLMSAYSRLIQHGYANGLL